MKFSLKLVLSVLLLFNYSLANAQKEKPKMISAYGLEISAGAELALVIHVNGVPFEPKAAGMTAALSIPINGEVLPGSNRVDVFIGTADIDPEALEVGVAGEYSDEWSLKLRLQRDEVQETAEGEYLTKVIDLDEKNWEPVQFENGYAFPQLLSLQFQAPADHPIPSWTKAEKFRPHQVEKGLEAAYRDILKKLQNGNAADIGRMSEIAYIDGAAAYPLGGDYQKRQKSDVDEIASLINDPEVVIPDISGPLRCRAYAEDRLFDCVAPDGQPPVRLLFPGEKPIYFTFRFSVIDNKLRIVR